MTKRGVQVGGEFRYLFDADVADAEPGPGLRRGAAGRPRRPMRRAGCTRGGTTSSSRRGSAPTSTSTRSPTTSTSPTSPNASPSRRSRRSPREGGLSRRSARCRVLARAEKFQTLQDPNAPITPPYNRVPQLLGMLREVSGAVRFSGIGEYARFRATTTQPTAIAARSIRRSNGAARARVLVLRSAR